MMTNFNIALFGENYEAYHEGDFYSIILGCSLGSRLVLRPEISITQFKDKRIAFMSIALEGFTPGK